MKELTLSDFIAKTASAAPVPGGGGVAALVSACGAALVGMLAALSTNEQKFANAGEMLQKSQELAQKAQDLLEFAEKDASVFAEYMRVLKLPKTTEAEADDRKRLLAEAAINATEVPLTLAQLAFEMMDAADYVVQNGNPNAVSDGAIGAMLLKSGVLSALYNVKINLPSVKDEAKKSYYQSEVQRLSVQSAAKEAEILQKVGF